MNNKIRCKWCNIKNPKYVKYHDEEWCRPNFNDEYLFEMLILESFQAGLSWECVLNKREDFRKAYDNFDIDKICNYDDNKVQKLLQNEKIIRNKLKIKASVNNAKIFKGIQKEYGTFYNYLSNFTENKIKGSVRLHIKFRIIMIFKSIPIIIRIMLRKHRTKEGD